MYLHTLTSCLLATVFSTGFLTPCAVAWAEPVEQAASSESSSEQDAPAVTLNFKGASLQQVLESLSKQAGFVIINPVELPEPITLVSRQTLTPDECIQALNSVLHDQGHVAVVSGRTLRVVPLAAARQHNIPVGSGSNPDEIGEGDHMMTQVIPVRHADAQELSQALAPLINTSYASLAANPSSNSLILTDTEVHIKRIAAVVSAVDQTISGEYEVRVFQICHANASSIASSINTIYGQANQDDRSWGRGGSDEEGDTRSGSLVIAASDDSTNSLVIRASPSMMTSLAQLVVDMDVDNTAKEGVMVYPVRYGDAEALATMLDQLFNEQPNEQGYYRSDYYNSNSNDDNVKLSGSVRATADPITNSLLLVTSERNFSALKDILDQIDRPVPQVLVRVLVAEMSYEEGLDLGVQLEAVRPAGDTTETRVFSNFNLFDSTLGMNGFLLENQHFRASVRALASTGRFDVLSRPYILTSDNRESTVNIGEEVPIITDSRTTDQGDTINSFDRRSVGIILTMTPQINGDGRVVLDIKQELSGLSEKGIPVAEGVESPIINQRTMDTRVAVETGQTVVVGGMVRDDLSEIVRKVPLLGDIPVLGEFFKRTEKTKRKTELLFFLTPIIIENPSDLADLATQLRGEMSRMDLTVEQGLLQKHLDQLRGLKLPGQKSESDNSISQDTPVDESVENEDEDEDEDEDAPSSAEIELQDVEEVQP